MTSPFPGMDPYLEQHWGDIHSRLIIYAADQLQTGLPSDLRARVEERVVLESGLGQSRSVIPDVRVVEHTRKTPRASAPARTGLALAEPLVIHLPEEPEIQKFIEILDLSSGRRVVTVLEILSPTNKKPGEGQELYLRKQSELVHAGVNLVEIDLLREGDWVLAVPLEMIQPEVQATFRAVVRRGWQRERIEYYPIPLRQKLPTLKIPLRKTDADVPLDLQGLLEQCYRNGGYNDIDYSVAPDLPLLPPDARWADRLLKDQGRRARRNGKRQR